MPAPGYLAPRSAGNAPAGPARTTVAAAIARITSVIRGLVLAYIVAQVLIWSPFYTARPARPAGPAAGLLAELQPALSAAQVRGLPLEIQVLG